VSAYREIADYEPRDASFPAALFGVVVERRFRSSLPMVHRERFAYGVLLSKFDAMLTRARRRVDSTRGLVIHDRRAVAERDIQDWTRQWQHAADTVPQLRNLADVPLFGDSRASRLLQAADLVSYALYRHYDPARIGADYTDRLWPRFDAADGAMHGCVHFTPSFGTRSCRCLRCTTRRADAPLFAALRSIPAVGHEWDADPAEWVRAQRAELRGRGGC
jgi:Protein of unknown function (DUF3800)